MALDQDEPIFSKTKRDLTPSGTITHAVISNKYLVVAMANNIIFRMDLHQSQKQDGTNLLHFNSYPI